MTRRRNQAILFLLLMVGGILAGAAIWAYRFGFQAEEEETSAPPSPSAFTLQQQPTPTVPLRPDKSAYPSLLAPTADIYEFIIESYLTEEGWQVNHLGNHIGHLQGTSWAGQGGNIVLAGHVEDSEGNLSVFAHIKEMQVGDPITLTDQDISYEYRVVEVKTVEYDDLSVVLPTSDETLTLITCTDYNFIQGIYTQRVIVRAERMN